MQLTWKQLAGGLHHGQGVGLAYSVTKGRNEMLGMGRYLAWHVMRHNADGSTDYMGQVDTMRSCKRIAQDDHDRRIDGNDGPTTDAMSGMV